VIVQLLQPLLDLTGFDVVALLLAFVCIILAFTAKR